MALETIASNFGQAGSKLSGSGPGTLKNVLKELQGLKVTIAAGAANAADMTVTGMTASDTVISVINLTDSTNLDPTKFTPKADAVTNITGSSLATKQCLIFWADKG